METVSCEKIGDWDVKLNKEGYEKDPATVKAQSYRYNLTSIDGCYYSIF